MTSEQASPQSIQTKSSEDVNVNLRTVSADLTVEIYNPDKDDQTFQCKVTTPLIEKYSSGKAEVWRLPSKAAEIVYQYMSDFTTRDADREDRLFSLKGAGIELFEVAPESFKEVFWALIDAGKAPRTILIASEERSIPWELMIPQRRRDSVLPERRNPLGVEFNVARWHQGDSPFHIQSMPLTNSRVVAPQYEVRQYFLEKAEDEAKFVCEYFNGAKIAPALAREIDSQLRDWKGTLLHFVCHGEASTSINQVILLESMKKLTSTQIGGMDGIVQACSSNKPLIFLNACEIGRPAPALVGVGGFAQRFIYMEASAVVAPLWSVRDEIAHEVALEFYKKVLADPRTPFGEILRQIRAKAYGDEGGEDTYAAYCFFGDPLLTAAPL